MGLCLEDVEVGKVYELGSYHFTRDNIIEFARKFDPQDFHLDDEAAERGPFGKLTASGWHTAAGWMKGFVAANQRAEETLRSAGREVFVVGPSPGFTNLKWPRPVCPGDTVTYRSTITGKRELVTRVRWGMVFAFNEGHNQRGELVYSFEGKVLAPRR
ncbi:MAG: MaoC family dehydratase [Alphaproteobacteria bacterium]|nr:MaoC family dehydratase [Alphaproteobacteria bacterium]